MIDVGRALRDDVSQTHRFAAQLAGTGRVGVRVNVLNQVRVNVPRSVVRTGQAKQVAVVGTPSTRVGVVRSATYSRHDRSIRRRRETHGSAEKQAFDLGAAGVSGEAIRGCGVPSTRAHPQEMLPSLTHPVLYRHPIDLLGRALMRVSSRRLPRNSVSWLIGASAGPDIVGHDWVE